MNIFYALIVCNFLGCGWVYDFKTKDECISVQNSLQANHWWTANHYSCVERPVK